MNNCKVIAVCTQKGGCAKTTTTLNLGIGLNRFAGKRVCVIDMDGQGNLTMALGVKDPNTLCNTTSDIMKASISGNIYPQADVVIKSKEGIDYIPANSNLNSIEKIITRTSGKYKILKKFVNSLRDDYDYILIDTSPSLGILTMNALCAADEVLIPCSPEYLSTKGLDELLDAVFRIKAHYNPGLEINGILPTMGNFRTNHSKNTVAEIKRQHPKINVYKSFIPRSIRVCEANRAGMSIYKYIENYSHAKECAVGPAYEQFTREVIANV